MGSRRARGIGKRARAEADLGREVGPEREVGPGPVDHERCHTNRGCAEPRGDLDGLVALLDPAVDGAGDIVPGVVVGADEVAPGILRYLGPPVSPTLLHLPVGDRIGIVALHDHRVLALVLLTIDNGLVVHVDALAGEGPRAAVSAVLGLR